MTKVAELLGHTERVLYMAMSPDGSVVVSATDAKTLMEIWAFAKPQSVHHLPLLRGLLPTPLLHPRERPQLCQLQEVGGIHPFRPFLIVVANRIRPKSEKYVAMGLISDLNMSSTSDNYPLAVVCGNVEDISNASRVSSKPTPTRRLPRADPATSSSRTSATLSASRSPWF